MASLFVSSYPSWLTQPSIVLNVFSNSFSPIKDVPASVNFTDNSSFMSGFRQALYWRRRLASAASSSTVIFSFLGVGGLNSPNISEVYRALRNIADITSPVEVYHALNSPFIGISFSDSSSAAIFRSLCCSFNDFLVVHVSPSDINSHTFKLIGLPPLFPDHRVHHFLSKYSASHSFIREVISPEENISIPLNSVIGSFQLKPSQTIDQLPHLIPLPPPHLSNALLIINGRQSLCLRCGGMGHIRRHCIIPRCTSCKHFHLASSSCNSSTSQLDASHNIDWQLDELSSPSSPLDLHTVSTISPECERIHESSSLNSSSPPSVTTSFAKVVSSCDFTTSNHVTTNLEAKTITYSPDNVSKPSNLFDISSLSSNTLSTPSKSLHTVSLPIIPKPLTNKQVVVSSIIRAKKDSLAYKRNRSLSSSSSYKHHCSSNNVYSALEDETEYIQDNLIPNNATSSSSVNLVKSASDPLDSSELHTSLPSFLGAPTSTASLALYSSVHKKSKKQKKSVPAKSSVLSNSMPPPPLPSLKDSWGERMEVESVISTRDTLHSIMSISSELQHKDALSPPCIASTSDLLPTVCTSQIISDSLSTPATISIAPLPSVSTSSILNTNIQPLSSSNNVLQDSTPSCDYITPQFPSSCDIPSQSNTDSDSCASYSDEEYHSLPSDTIISVKGLPINTSVLNIYKIFGKPLPIHICMNEPDHRSPSGSYFLFFNKNVDYQHILDRDGSWHEGVILSIAIKRRGKEALT